MSLVVGSLGWRLRLTVLRLAIVPRGPCRHSTGRPGEARRNAEQEMHRDDAEEPPQDAVAGPPAQLPLENSAQHSVRATGPRRLGEPSGTPLLVAEPQSRTSSCG